MSTCNGSANEINISVRVADDSPQSVGKKGSDGVSSSRSARNIHIYLQLKERTQRKLEIRPKFTRLGNVTSQPHPSLMFRVSYFGKHIVTIATMDSQQSKSVGADA